MPPNQNPCHPVPYWLDRMKWQRAASNRNILSLPDPPNMRLHCRSRPGMLARRPLLLKVHTPVGRRGTAMWAGQGVEGGCGRGLHTPLRKKGFHGKAQAACPPVKRSCPANACCSPSRRALSVACCLEICSSASGTAQELSLSGQPQRPCNPNPKNFLHG